MQQIKDLENLEIQNFIIHKLDSENNEPFLTDKINIDNKTRKLLKEQLESAVKNKHGKFAEFSSDSTVYSICSEIFESQEKFILKSKEIALKLFAIIKKDKRISSSNLLVCLYSTNHGTFIATLKTDFIENSNLEYKVENGKNIAVLKYNEVAFPHKKDLHKCFFYGMTEDGFNLMIIDKQSGNKEVAEFFFKDFLECKLLKTDKDCCSDFYEKTKNFIDSTTLEKSEKDKMKIELIEVLKSTNKIDAEVYAQARFSEELREQYIDHLHQNSTDLVFDVDKDWAKNFNKIKLKLDNGMTISLDESIKRDLTKFEIKPKSNGKFDIFIKNVKYEESQG